jgi:hypothetical protein
MFAASSACIAVHACMTHAQQISGLHVLLQKLATGNASIRWCRLVTIMMCCQHCLACCNHTICMLGSTSVHYTPHNIMYRLPMAWYYCISRRCIVLHNAQVKAGS